MRIAYFTHSLASCWNHGNAHFLRGVLRDLMARGHAVTAYEPENAWNTTLRLTLPRLGGVEARLHLTPAGVALRLVADDTATLQTLDGGQNPQSASQAGVEAVREHSAIRRT